MATSGPDTVVQDGAAHDLLAGGQVNDAIRSLSLRIAADPQDAEAYHLLSRAYYEVEQWDQSIAAAQHAVLLRPQSSEYHLWLARAYGNKAEHSMWFTAISLAKKARVEFERAVELDAANVDARADLAEYYVEAPGFLGGGKDKARAQAEQLAAYDESAAHWVKARLAEKDSRLIEAEQEYKAAIAASPAPGGEWLNLAAFYRHQKRYKEMEDAINHAVSFGTKKTNVLYEAASLLYRAGRNFPGAAQLVRAYLNSKPHDEQAPAFQAHYLLGQILEKQGDKRAAADEYRAALSLASDYREAREALKRMGQ